MCKFIQTTSNIKTGPIPITYTARSSCPSICPLKTSGCYAESGPVRLAWNRADTGIDTKALTGLIKTLPKGQLWRHNVAGDLLHDNEVIRRMDALSIAEASRGKNGFTYTHHNMSIKANRSTIKAMNSIDGFTVNLSGNSLGHADTLAELNIGPVVTIVPIDHPTHSETPAGRPVIVCPATRMDNMTCQACQLCANKNRRSIVAFPVHGVGKKKVHKVFIIASSKG